jgi:sortase A
MSMRPILRRVSIICLLAGAFVLGGYASLVVHAREYQVREMRRFNSMVMTAKPAAPAGRVPQLALNEPVLRTGSVFGELEIPRLGIHTMVLQGDNSSTLRLGAGHIPETAMPDDPGGNVGIAAHRDTYFRPLRFIRPQDLIIVRTRTGSYRYRVESTQVVEPNDVALLNNTGERSLTLVTCYPFYFVGSAPHRFIVRAEAVE